MALSLSAWLSCADPLRSADAIFVLAGRESRKHYGLQLFRQGTSPRILFSVSRFEIRRFSKMQLPVPLDLLKIAADVPPPRRHYFVLFEAGKVEVEYVEPGRFGTLTEIKSLARWLNKNPKIESLLIISTGTHLRRVRLCCRSLLGTNIQRALVAAPDSPPSENDDRPGMFSSRVAELEELSKVALYWLLLKLLPHPNAG